MSQSIKVWAKIRPRCGEILVKFSGNIGGVSAKILAKFQQKVERLVELQQKNSGVSTEKNREFGGFLAEKKMDGILVKTRGKWWFKNIGLHFCSLFLTRSNSS